MDNNEEAVAPPANVSGTEQGMVSQDQAEFATNSTEANQAEINGGANSKKLGMGKMLGLIVLVLLLLGGAVFGAIKIFGNNGGGTGNDPEISDVVGDFSVRFLKLENNERNMIYSPLSIKYGLSLLRDGASGETREEIDGVLNGIGLTKYTNVEDKLSLANAVFIRDDFTEYTLDAYKNDVINKYNAEIMFDSFQTTATLDKWVDDKTFGLIKKMGLTVNDDVRMVLSNALAIQMNWKDAFNGSSYGRDFYLADGSKFEAMTLSYDATKKESVGYYMDDDVTMASIDLEEMDDGTQLEFVAVMPKKVALKDYIRTVNIDDVIGIENKKTLANYTKDGVDLYIPKFKFEHGLNFINDLRQLGIEKAFIREEADFSKMVDLVKIKQDYGADDVYFYVSDAIHKANIDFSEKGIKAAAVTAFAMTKDMAIGPVKHPVQIVIDHPFMFLIMDKKTQEIWFVGTVYEPEEWDEDSWRLGF